MRTKLGDQQYNGDSIVTRHTCYPVPGTDLIVEPSDVSGPASVSATRAVERVPRPFQSFIGALSSAVLKNFSCAQNWRTARAPSVNLPEQQVTNW